MINWSSIQLTIDDHINILLDRLKKEDFLDGFIVPKIKDYFIYIFSFFAFFSIVYLSLDTIFKKIWKNKHYLKLSNYGRADWNSRIVAFTHAIIISPFCVSLVCKYGFPWNKTENDYNEQEIDLYYKAISISLGYFLWDIFYSISDYKKGGIGFIIHGICAFIIYIFTFKNHVLGHYSMIYLNYEISTIFLNIYWTLDKLELSGSALQMVVAVLLMITFFSVRVAFGTITLSRLLYDIIFQRRVCSVYLCLYFFINILVMQALNFYWFYIMIQSVTKDSDTPSEPKKDIPIKPRQASKGKKSTKKTN
jgi:hypothetical protein